MTLDAEALAMYRTSRLAFVAGDVATAERWYRRLRAEHGLEAYYEVELPERVRLVHPIATVLGRAQYADYLCVYQGVCVGSDVDGGRPKFMGPCVLFPQAKVLGNVTVGANVWITAGTCVAAPCGETLRIPDNVVVFPCQDGDALRCGWRLTTRSVRERFFQESA